MQAAAATTESQRLYLHFSWVWTDGYSTEASSQGKHMTSHSQLNYVLRNRRKFALKCTRVYFLLIDAQYVLYI